MREALRLLDTCMMEQALECIRSTLPQGLHRIRQFFEEVGCMVVDVAEGFSMEFPDMARENSSDKETPFLFRSAVQSEALAILGRSWNRICMGKHHFTWLAIGDTVSATRDLRSPDNRRGCTCL